MVSPEPAVVSAATNEAQDSEASDQDQSLQRQDTSIQDQDLQVIICAFTSIRVCAGTAMKNSNFLCTLPLPLPAGGRA